MRIIALALALAAAPSFAHDGWISSGGEFIKDGHNPWFVKNAPKISVCLKIDPLGISAAPQRARELTEMALAYWKREFSSGDKSLGVGLQDVAISTAADCAATADLTLQFGYGTLDQDQRAFFAKHEEDARHYLGLAVRTAYDPIQLRGKGFVFIASDRGPDAYVMGESARPTEIWRYDGLLYRLLLHELGHVFGIPHQEKGFMSERFSEEMLRSFFDGKGDYRLADNVAPFFRPALAHRVCGMDARTLEQVFAFKPDQAMFTCLDVQADARWNYVVFRLVKTNGELIKELGRAEVTQKTFSSIPKFPMTLFITPEQRVFQALPGETTLFGPSQVEISFGASFKRGDAQVPMFFRISSASMEILAVVDGAIQELVR